MSWQIYDGWNGTRDGNWSTFKLRVGSPSQILPAVISASNSWVHLPFAESPQCIGNDTGRSFDCSDHVYDGRDFLYQPCRSTTAQNSGNCESFSDVFDDGHPDRHELVLSDTRWMNDSIKGHGEFLTYSMHAGCIGMLMRFHKHYPREEFEESLYSHGVPGVTRADSFFQSFPQFYWDERDRPLSLTYGYTAGAWYRNTTASLSIGSVDPSRIGAETRTIPFLFTSLWPGEGGLSNDVERILRIHFESLNASAVLNVPAGGLRSNYFDRDDQQGFSVFLDPQNPWLELPEPTCLRIAHDFDLIHDVSHGLFLVSEETRARLRKIRPSFTLTLTWNIATDDWEVHVPPIDIVLPYEAFEHDLTNGDGSVHHYFPIRVAHQGKHANQIILGRVFFQEAYLAVDYHKRYYNLSTARFPVNDLPNVDENLIWYNRTWKDHLTTPPPSYQAPSWSFSWLYAVGNFLLLGLKWFALILEWLVLILLLVGFLHFVLPRILSLPKAAVWWHRQRKIKQVWIARHTKGESADQRELTRRRKRAERMRVGAPSGSAIFVATKKMISVVGSGIAWAGQWVYARLFSRVNSGQDDSTINQDADLIDMESAYAEAEELRRRHDEQQRNRREEERRSQARARQFGAKIGTKIVEYTRKGGSMIFDTLVTVVGFFASEEARTRV